MTCVLIVDKNEAVGEMLTRALELQGYEAIAALDVDQAFQAVERRSPDIILLDLMLTSVSGIQFLEMLITRGIRSRFQVIVMSADEDRWYDERTGSKIAAEGYLSKPFRLSVLYNQIARVATSPG